ncbi:MAG TPA: sensor histidine kinase [Cytophagales bacterium]|nr:sensor histidine kinase [Cytophagales bacterium]
MKNQNNKIALLEISWWLTWTILQASALNLAGFSWGISATDAIFSNFVLGWEGYAIILMLKFYQPDKSKLYYLLLWSAALAGICVLVIEFGLAIVFEGNTTYLQFLDNTALLRFGFSFLMLAFISILGWVWFYLQTQQKNEIRKADVDKMSKEAELYSLRQQLQPHFLFNSLNSINALIGADPAKARTMVQQLSDFFRGTLRRQESHRVTFSEELDQLKLYLEIEKVRFGHRLKTEIIHDDASPQMMIPSLLLQPVVENAIKFGLYDVTGDVLLSVHAEVKNDYLMVCVENPFDPDTVPPKGTGFGLTSIERRLYLLYGRNDLLTTEKTNSKFRTCLQIPQIK